MRLLLPLSLLMATTLAYDNWGEAITDAYGKCNDKCMATEFESHDCGSVSSSSSTDCYCENYTEIYNNLSTKYTTCAYKCGLDNIDYGKWAKAVANLCPHGVGLSGLDDAGSDSTDDTGSDSTDDAGSDSTDDSGSTDDSSSEDSSPPDDAASTLSSSRAAVVVGALAFLGFAL